MREGLQELRSKMIFQGYGSKDLDAISSKYQERFGKTPLAFLARSPFGIHGSMENKKKLVISQKYGAANIVLVAALLDRAGLENTIYALGEISQRVYVSRRKAVELQEKKELAATLTYEKHCTHCGKKYIVHVDDPQPTCGSPTCIIKRKEYMASRAQYRESANENRKPVDKNAKLPEFSLDDPSHNSLQGYIYCVRATNGLCKIGRSANPEERFLSLVTMSPVDLYLDHTVFSDNYVMAEGYVHDELKNYRHHGEWFDLPENIHEWFLSLDNYELDTPSA